MSEGLPNIEILARYLNREISEDQLLQESEGLDEFVRLAKMAETLEVPGETATSTAWARFSKRVGEEKQAEQTIVKPLGQAPQRTRILSIAAAIGALLIAAFLLMPGETNIETGFGQNETVSLPDGSEVNIFASSELSYKKGNWENKRELELEGEAFFNVQKGESFTVHTPQGDVRVLGTSFNVFQRGEQFEVVCYTGKVEVSSKGQKEILTPGEKAILSGQDLSKGSFDESAKEPAWMSGKVKVENASLSDISKMFERYYGYQLEFDPSLETTFSGVFLTQDLKKSLKVICDPIELNYIFEDNRTILLSK